MGTYIVCLQLQRSARLGNCWIIDVNFRNCLVLNVNESKHMAFFVKVSIQFPQQECVQLYMIAELEVFPNFDSLQCNLQLKKQHRTDSTDAAHKMLEKLISARLIVLITTLFLDLSQLFY